MFCSSQRLATAVANALVVCFVHGAAAQDSQIDGNPATVARGIRQTVEQLQNVRQERRTALQEHQMRIVEIEQQIEEMQRQLSAISGAAASEQQKVEALEEESRARQAAASAAASWIEHVAAGARRVAGGALEHAERVSGGDHVRQRSMLNEIGESLDSTEPEVQVQGLHSLLTFIGEQWPVLRSVKLANEPLLLSGDERMEHAWVVEIGSAAKVFMSEDEQVVGVWTGRPGNPWTIDVPDAVRKQIVELVGVVRETSPPLLTPLPILVPADDRGASQ